MAQGSDLPLRDKLGKISSERWERFKRSDIIVGTMILIYI